MNIILTILLSILLVPVAAVSRLLSYVFYFSSVATRWFSDLLCRSIGLKGK